MSLLLIAALSGLVTELRVSDGTGFFQLPDTVWAMPGCRAVLGADTLAAAPGARGSRTGILVDPPPAAGDTVVLVYTTAALSIPSTARVSIPPDGGRVVVEGSLPVPSPPASGLVISGVKRLGVSVGQGGGLDQGTRLSISGTVASGIEVEGTLSDENLPLGASSSEQVSQLDMVALSITGRDWRADFGDMTWERAGDGLLSWDRDVMGIRASAGPGGLLAEGGAAISGNSGGSASFQTEEGLQGPYSLAGGDEIAPGTERVWLDGAEMTRGASRDYTIDYLAGTITFSPSRLIRRGQRVEATFQTRGDGYRKNLYTASSGWGSDGASILLTGFSEADDRGSPLGFTLSDEAEDLLRSIGEEPDSAWTDGAAWVGPGEGSYSVDSLGRFVYEGPGQGEWRVVFSRPPDEAGDYVYDSSLGGFAWVGEDLGTHLPRQYLEIPSSLEVGGALLAAGGADLSFDGAVALSRRVGNTFNPDVTTRAGSAFRGLLGAGSADGLHGTLGLLAASGGFEPAGTWLPDSTLSGWGLPGGTDSRDAIVQVTAGLASVSLLGGVLLAEGGGRTLRLSGSASPAAGSFDAGLRASAIARRGTPGFADGSRVRGGMDVHLSRGSLRPFAGVEADSEEWADSVSGERGEVTGGLEIGSDSWLTVLSGSLERDWRSGGGLPWRTWRLRGETEGPVARGRLRASLEHSVSDWEYGSTLADAVSADYSVSGGGSWLNATYRGSGVLSGDMEVHYRYVGEGEGSYSWDPSTGEYYPDPDGDWEVYYTPGEGGDPVLEAALETEFVIGGSGGLSLEGAAGLEARGGGRLETFLLAGAFGEGPGGYLLELSPVLRQDALLSLLRLRGRVSNDRTSYSGAGVREESARRLELTGRLDWSAVFRTAWEAGVWRELEELYTDRDRRGFRAGVDPSLEVAPGLEPGLLLAAENRTETVGGLDETMYEAAPHLSWVRSGWSAYASFSAGLIPGSGELPSWFFEGSDRGLSIRAQGRIGRYLQSGLAISLTGYARRPAGSEWVRRIGLEGSVSF